MSKRIIFINGKQGSGKTTLARGLHQLLPQIRVVKFADPIYKMHDLILPYIKDIGLRNTELQADKDLLQVLGTEYGRQFFGHNVWARIARNTVDSILAADYNAIVILDDGRFKDEFDLFPDAMKIRLEADREIRKARCSYWREKESHISEVDLDSYVKEGKFDMILDTGKYTKPEILSMVIGALTEDRLMESE